LALDGAQLNVPAAVPPWIVSPLLIKYEAWWISVLSGVSENYVRVTQPIRMVSVYWGRNNDNNNNNTRTSLQASKEREGDQNAF
jgi:hypothetical protein